MFVIVPYRADVAGHERPWGTTGVIAANLLVALLFGFPVEPLPGILGLFSEKPFINSWILEFGTINPLTWFTSAFTHLDWFHLIFNMAFLWAFGMVVEAHIGWKRFLAIYFTLVAVEGAVVQTIMLGASYGGAAGASGAIFGLMAIAALWAPRNLVTYFWLFFVFFDFSAQITVWAFCVGYIAFQFVGFLLLGFGMSSELLHIIGAGIGGGVGVLMLHKHWVRTAGWDYFSLRKNGPPKMVVHAAVAEAQDFRTDGLQDVYLRIRDALGKGEVLAADSLYQRARKAMPRWRLPSADHKKLMNALLRHGQMGRAIACMEEYLRFYPSGSDPMRLSAAGLLLELERYEDALKHVELLNDRMLSEEQLRAKADLGSRARAALGSVAPETSA